MANRRQGAHLRPVLVPTRFAALWWSMLFAGTALLAGQAAHLNREALVVMGPAFWCIAALVVLGELRPVVTSKYADPDGVNVATAFLFAVLLHWGFGATLALVVLATIVGEVARRKRVYALLFNVCQYAVSYAAAWACLRLFGWAASPASPVEMLPLDLFVVLAAALAYHVVNYTVVSLAIAFIERRGPLRVLRRGILYYFVTTMAVIALSPLVVVIVMVHWGFLPLVLFPLGLVYRTAEMSRDREHDAMHDALTGVANRMQLMRRAQQVLEEDRQQRRTGLLCVIDLDGFKAVNDQHGHVAGDRLLQIVTERLTAAVRETDLVARLGGDEFAVLMPAIEQESRHEIVARLQDVFADPFKVCGAEVVVRGSIGSVQFPDADDHDLDGLLRIADAEMYARKHAELEARARSGPPSSLDLWAEAVRSTGTPPERR